MRVLRRMRIIFSRTQHPLRDKAHQRQRSHNHGDNDPTQAGQIHIAHAIANVSRQIAGCEVRACDSQQQAERQQAPSCGAEARPRIVRMRVRLSRHSRTPFHQLTLRFCKTLAENRRRKNREKKSDDSQLHLSHMKLDLNRGLDLDRLSIQNVRAILPLLYCFDSRFGEKRIAANQGQLCNSPFPINDRNSMISWAS